MRISLYAMKVSKVPEKTLKQVTHVPHIYSTQTMQTKAYFGPTVPVNNTRCANFVSFKCRLKAHILFYSRG